MPTTLHTGGKKAFTESRAQSELALEIAEMADALAFKVSFGGC